MSTAAPVAPTSAATPPSAASLAARAAALARVMSIMAQLSAHMRVKRTIFIVAAGCTLGIPLLTLLLLSAVRMPGGARMLTLVIGALATLAPWVTYALYDLTGMRRIVNVAKST